MKYPIYLFKYALRVEFNQVKPHSQGRSSDTVCIADALIVSHLNLMMTRKPLNQQY
jgi:hypothetical protein